jgi:hypothetical protein
LGFLFGYQAKSLSGKIMMGYRVFAA